MTRTAAKVLLDTIAAHGIDRAFCVPGESYLAVMDTLHDDPVVDLVTCRHEGGAAWMALADAKLTGRAGVVFASRGPGASNAAIAAHSAQQGSFPLVLMLGQVGRGKIGSHAMQEMNYHTTFGDMAKWIVQVDIADRISEIVARAIHIAESGTPGPVVVSLPTDVLASACAGEVIARTPRAAMRPNDSDVARICDILGAAQRPLMIVGGRVQGTQAKRTLQAVSEAWAVPVMPTYTHQDVFSNEHPNYAGEAGIRPPDTVLASAKHADVVIAVGTKFSGLGAFGGALPQPGQRIIHVYPDQQIIGRESAAELGVVADAGAFLEAMAERNAPEPSTARKQWLAAAHAGYTDFAHQPARESSDGMDFGHVIEAMKDTIAHDAIFTVDAGSFASWLHLKYPFKSTQMLLGSECGAMGMGIPAAVAAAIRYPHRQVVAVVGDGGALMSGYELATAASQGVKNLRIIISNNNAYGTIRFHQEKFFPARPHATDLVNPDFAVLAQAFGAKGLVIDKAQDAVQVLREAMAHDGVVVIEARTSLENVDARNTIAALRSAG